jgi:hypothetical protein
MDYLKFQKYFKIIVVVFIIAVLLISALALLLVYTGVLSDSVNETICGLFTSATRRWLGDACN